MLEEGRLRRLGGKVELEVDVRVLCATNRDLKAEIASGASARTSTSASTSSRSPLPPLRERREDIPLLVQHFVEKFNRESGKQVSGVHPEAMEVLRAYDWPGNIRELQNAVERAVILCDGELISRDHLPPDMAGKGPERHVLPHRLRAHADAVEKEYILGQPRSGTRTTRRGPRRSSG